MKNDFLNKFKNGIKSAINFSDDDDQEYYDDEYYEDEYEDEYYEEDEKEEVKSDIDIYSKSSQKKSSRFNEYDSAPAYSAPAYEAPKKTTSGAKIYDMNSAKPQKDLNINLFVLEDLDDARNVADCMKKRNMVCIVDFSRLTLKEERRILDFLDGVKYILQSKVTKIADRMYLIVPSTTILTGPFEDNFDIDYD